MNARCRHCPIRLSYASTPSALAMSVALACMRVRIYACAHIRVYAMRIYACAHIRVCAYAIVRSSTCRQQLLCGLCFGWGWVLQQNSVSGVCFQSIALGLSVCKCANASIYARAYMHAYAQTHTRIHAHEQASSHAMPRTHAYSSALAHACAHTVAKEACGVVDLRRYAGFVDVEDRWVAIARCL